MRTCGPVGTGRCSGEAQKLVTEAPLRERRWALLALAQYRAGRQGEALRTLHLARARRWPRSWGWILAPIWSRWSRRSCARTRL